MRAFCGLASTCWKIRQFTSSALPNHLQEPAEDVYGAANPETRATLFCRLGFQCPSATPTPPVIISERQAHATRALTVLCGKRVDPGYHKPSDHMLNNSAAHRKRTLDDYGSRNNRPTKKLSLAVESSNRDLGETGLHGGRHYWPAKLIGRRHRRYHHTPD